MADRLVLVLPLPPAINRQKAIAFAHPMALIRAKTAYKRDCWQAATEQAMPRHELDLPTKVRITSVLYVRNRRDADKAMGCLEWPLDALKARQPDSDDLRWRFAYELKGYFVDDDAAHAIIEPPEQRIERKGANRLVITIEPMEG